jgi:hypothetical protein
VPTTDRLPEDVLTSIAGQLADFLPRGVTVASAAATPSFPEEVGESFAVCPVTLQQVRRPPANLSVLARPSGYWHHQLRMNSVATHTAVSTKPGFGPVHEVEQVFESPLAGRIDAVITWVDKYVKGKGTVRLLTIPAYLTHGLLVVRPDDTLEAVLVDQPPQYTQLQYETVYTLPDFLKRLAKEPPAESLS